MQYKVTVEKIFYKTVDSLSNPDIEEIYSQVVQDLDIKELINFINNKS